MRTKRVLVAAFLVALVGLPAAAQEADAPGPITWIAYSTVNPGMTADAVAFTLEDKPFYDGLLADGTILSWGMGTPINHSPEDNWNHVHWVTVADWGKIEDWIGKFMQHNQAMDEAERTARHERAEQIYVAGSHFDEVVRHDVFRVGSGDAPMRYLYSGEFAAKPGREDDLVRFFEQAVVPVVDRLVEDGTMTSYGVYSPDLHLDVDWTHRLWYGLPNLGSIQTMQQAFAAAAGPEFQSWAESIFEARGHYDKVLMILHFERAGSQ